MRINYTLKAEDLLAFYKRGLKSKSFIFKNYIFGIGVIIALLLSYYDSYIRNTPDSLQLSTYSNNYWFMAAYNLVLVTICIFLFRLIFISFLRIQMRSKTKFLGERGLETLKDKVVFSSQGSKTEYQFKVIKKIEDNRHHYFVYVNDISAIIVPKKTVGSKDIIAEISEKAKLNVTIY